MSTLHIQNGVVVPAPPSWWARLKVTFAALCLIQGLYYLLTGSWPLLSLDTFEAITGPKSDGWLVKTVGCLVLIEAAVLLVAAWRRSTAPEIIVLAIGTAFMLTLVDVIYVCEGVISAVYLLDAIVEIVLMVGWLRFLTTERRAGRNGLPGVPPRI